MIRLEVMQMKNIDSIMKTKIIGEEEMKSIMRNRSGGRKNRSIKIKGNKSSIINHFTKKIGTDSS
jgi:hypothetical protein